MSTRELSDDEVEAIAKELAGALDVAVAGIAHRFAVANFRIDFELASGFDQLVDAVCDKVEEQFAAADAQ